jgi:hypothetical protein
VGVGDVVGDGVVVVDICSGVGFPLLPLLFPLLLLLLLRGAWTCIDLTRLVRVGKGEAAPSDLDPEIGMTSSIAFSKVMVGVMCCCGLL